MEGEVDTEGVKDLEKEEREKGVHKGRGVQGWGERTREVERGG